MPAQGSRVWVLDRASWAGRCTAAPARVGDAAEPCGPSRWTAAPELSAQGWPWNPIALAARPELSIVSLPASPLTVRRSRSGAAAAASRTFTVAGSPGTVGCGGGGGGAPNFYGRGEPGDGGVAFAAARDDRVVARRAVDHHVVGG